MDSGRTNPQDKLILGENHRRVISVLLRGLEQMCDETEQCLAKKSGLLLHSEKDLTAEQQSEIRRLTDRLRSEIRRLTQEIELEPKVQSARRTIRALLSAKIVELEESDSSRLKGYGRLSEEAKKKLDAELPHLTGLLERMVQVVEKG